MECREDGVGYGRAWQNGDEEQNLTERGWNGVREVVNTGMMVHTKYTPVQVQEDPMWN